MNNEMNKDLVNAVNRLTEWDKLMKEGRQEQEKLKLVIQRAAEKDFDGSKMKQLKYWGDGNRCAIVTTTEKIDLISREYLAQVIPENLLEDFVEKDVKYKLTAAIRNILGPLATGAYTEQTLAGVVQQMNLTPDTAKVALKKLKGRFEKDVDWLTSIGFEREKAEHWAYFVQEAVAWERIVKLLQVAGYEPDTTGFKRAMEELKHAVIVEETLKIGVEYDD